MTENIVPRGPEDVPLKSFIKELFVVVLIKDIKSGRYIREERINYSDPEVRRWLGRCSYWAWSNQYQVETLSLKDYEEFKNNNG